MLRYLHNIDKSLAYITLKSEELCISDKLIADVTFKNKEFGIREIQKAQLELKRMMCGKSQVAYIYDQLRPSFSLIYEFKVSKISQWINEGAPYITEEICTGPRGYTIAYLIYFNGEDTKDTWGQYMSIYLLVKEDGYFDDGLDLPFDLPVTLTLLLSDQTISHYQMTHRRGLDPSNEILSYQVVSASTHFAPRSVLSKSIYVENDCVHFLCTLSQ